MLDKYINFEKEKFRYKQNADGTWICVDLRADTIIESKTLIGEVNKMLNEFNKKEKEKKTKNTTDVKGLK